MSVKIIKYLYFYLFLSILISGLIAYGKYNLLPVKLMLNVSLLLMFFLSLNHINKKVIFVSVLAFTYLFYTSIIVLFRDSINFIDYLTAYLSFVFILILTFFVKKEYVSREFFNKLYFYMLLLTAFKYGYTILLNLANRPGIFGENNYEVLFFVLLYIAYYAINEHKEKKYLIFLSIIVLLSGSRSGIVIYLATMSILYFKLKYFRFKFIILYILGFAIVIVLLMQILNRMPESGIEGVDRYQFLLYFIYEIRNWNILNFLIGNPVLTPLSDPTCSSLGYYSSLFSNKHDGTCYSVILHSYILRIIFDHGLLGLLFIFGALNHLLYVSKYSLKIRISILIAIFLNGLSVSSFNNILTIAAIALILSIYKKKEFSERYISNYINIQ